LSRLAGGTRLAKGTAVLPSPLHEFLVALFRGRPTLAPEVLADLLGVKLPDFVEARIEDKAFPKVLPERHADKAIVLRNEAGRAVFGIIVELAAPSISSTP